MAADVVVVVPSPQLHLYWMIESPGNGTVLPDALNRWATPAATVPGAWITAVGKSGWNGVTPLGVPTPETPS